jgi:phospholipid/cholesterol/gamma-HCH transport system substrate-binding protein
MVGGLLLGAMVYLGFLAIHLGQATLTDSGYVLYADFASASGLHTGDPIKIAGVKIGEVKSIALGENYLARVALRVQDKVKVYNDAVASIETDGLIGDRFVSITPGTSDNRLDPKERIARPSRHEAFNTCWANGWQVTSCKWLTFPHVSVHSIVFF